jgi:SAM-dependent methyltransferase
MHVRAEALRAVREVYDAVGEHGSTAPSGLVLATGRQLAVSLGYPPAKLDTVPGAMLDAFVGAGPVAVVAGPKPGQVIVDVGCGAGVDSYLGARAGARVLAVDASGPMLNRLSMAVAAQASSLAIDPVRAVAPHLPVANDVADWLWLNGVANLIADRPALCAEVARVLRPGGRLLLADVFAAGPVPPELRDLPEAWAWCVAGAAEPEEWRQRLGTAGLSGVSIDIVEEFPPFCRGMLRARWVPTAHR